ncbi:MAG: AbrB/MazE/SpoVT family DNA-binding domain-containing protein [Candidatus Devosia phytovorans]|uniref:AbrB/MazE/SpoVT family DNA-binding domain-containing protein n=1 Tax=Candidatus Devosia phytovorans TaxID=3121372 RepID=A0AAJ5VU65_9HYPH|nr:AbrB/MazE/SpoVT family DNA-binding domain-containing protein [Devosia sp.]WEK04901.1 MAG: AbrB/MazE/SpoVT family DNA-binding domain-containing protein [Devosia sp.]
MASATMTSKGQMTLPKDVRDELGLKPGDKVDIVKQGGVYTLRPRNVRATELYGMLHRPDDKAMTPKEEDEAFAAALAEDEERIRAGR